MRKNRMKCFIARRRRFLSDSAALCGAAVLVLALAATPTTAAADRALPPRAAAVIAATFPDATVTGIGRERERGAWYYEVALRNGGRRMEVEITDEGVIGEIESKVASADMPAVVLQRILARIGAGRIARIEKHERYGIARSGRFVPLQTPTIMYEVKYLTARGERRELQVSSNEILELDERILHSIQAEYPGSTIRLVRSWPGGRRR